MAPTPSTSSSHSPEEQFRVVRKRNRVPLNCLPCRTKKLKCDRGRPCGNCLKKEGADPASCSYATPSTRSKKTVAASQTPDDMQNRIDRLEGLVLSLMHGGAQLSPGRPSPNSGTMSSGTTSKGNTASPEKLDEPMDDDDDEASSENDDVALSLGLLKIDEKQGRAMYFGEQHWHAVLADISEVKNYFAANKKEIEDRYQKALDTGPAVARHGPAFLRGVDSASIDELRAQLPPKTQILSLVARYFDSIDGSSHLLHAPSFNKQLLKHWRAPQETSVMFLGLVYSVMCLTMLGYHKMKDEPPEYKGRALDLAAEYRIRTVQCLAAADYTSPVEYTIETMLLYLFGEYSSKWDADLGYYLIMGMIVRLAYRMGYHRDAKWFPGFTPFQAEMRRRVWAFVRVADIMFSLQVTLPSMIDTDECDTQLPTNLNDQDFGPDDKVLPPARPFSDSTPILPIIYKTRFYVELGSIVKLTSKATRPPSYHEILEYDERLNRIYKELPESLRARNIPADADLNNINSRYYLEISYQKIRCILHRGFASKAREDRRYDHSRAVAIGAAMASLGLLQELVKASRPGGRLESIRTYVTTTATKNFVLPVVLICSDLHRDKTVRDPHQQRAKLNSNDKPVGFWDKKQRRQLIQTLVTTRDIWKDFVDTSLDAYKVGKILDVMLKSIQGESHDLDEAMGNGDAADDLLDSCGPGVVGTGPLVRASIPAPPLIPGMEPEPILYDPASLSGTGLPESFFEGYQDIKFSSAEPSIPVPVTQVPNGFLGEIPGSYSGYPPMNTNDEFTSMLNTMSSIDPETSLNWDAFDQFAQSSAAFSIDPNMGIFSGPVQTGGAMLYNPTDGSSLTPESRRQSGGPGPSS